MRTNVGMDKHKIGDKVKIKSEKELMMLSSEYDVVSDMFKYAEKVATIIDIDFGYYILDVDDGEWGWELITLK